MWAEYQQLDALPVTVEELFGAARGALAGMPWKDVTEATPSEARLAAAFGGGIRTLVGTVECECFDLVGVRQEYASGMIVHFLFINLGGASGLVPVVVEIRSPKPR